MQGNLALLLSAKQEPFEKSSNCGGVKGFVGYALPSGKSFGYLEPIAIAMLGTAQNLIYTLKPIS